MTSECLTHDAAALLERYLEDAHAWADRNSLDGDELTAELRDHVAQALADAPAPVDRRALQAVLDELGAPAGWDDGPADPGAARADASRTPDEQGRTGGRAGAAALAGGATTASLPLPVAELAVALLFWGGLLLTGALSVPPLLPLLAWGGAWWLTDRTPAGAPRSPLVRPPLLAGELAAWSVAVVFPAVLLMALVTEGSPVGRLLGGGSSAVGAALAVAAALAVLAAGRRLCSRRPLARRLLPGTAGLVVRLPGRALGVGAALCLVLAAALRLGAG